MKDWLIRFENGTHTVVSGETVLGALINAPSTVNIEFIISVELTNQPEDY